MGASHSQSDGGEAAIDAGRARTDARRLFSAATLVTVGLFLVRPAAAQTVINVTDGASLSAAIAQVDSNASASYVINLQNNITLTSAASNTLNAFNTTSNVIVNGNGFTLDGGSVQRGFLVYSGTVAIENVTIQNTQALGGSSSNAFRSGGAGAGLGGALFVASAGAVTMSNVTLLSNNATGGNGGSGSLGSSAGGGMGGDGSASSGGGVGLGANGGSSGSPNGPAGIVVGAGPGGNGVSIIGSGSGGANGGGGGFLGGGGGVNGSNGTGNSPSNGGNGGFGGGGGSGQVFGGNGGFGGGGGAGQAVGGNGGFGGGGGGGDSAIIGGHDGSGGFGGGNGGGGGGGAGLGGAIFVQQGGGLTLAGPLTVNGNTVTAGAGGATTNNGSAFGTGLFLQGSGTLLVQPGSAQTQTISDVIADEVGVVAKGYTPPAGTFTGNESWSLAKSGSGTLVLSAANSYSGGTVISAGTLQLSGAGTLGLATATTTINSGGTLNLGGTTQTQAGVNLAGGTLQNGALSAAISSTGGTIDNIGGNASLTTTAGVTTVTGANSYTGPTTVNGGVLNVTGTISDPTVNLGGVLTGIGTVGVTQINAGGIFMPGSGAPGTAMTIAGNLAFASGALYVVALNPSTSSFASVSGTVTLGGTVNAVFAPGSYLAKQYLILQSAGISGRFSSLANSNLPAGFTDSLGYTNNAVVLNLVATLGVLSAQQGLSPNQQTIANTLAGFFNNGGALPPNFIGVFGLTGNNLSNALSQLNGEAATGAEISAFQLMNEFLDLMLDPFASGRGFGSTGGGAIGFASDQQASLPPEIALAYAGVLKAPPAGFDQRWSVWGGAFGGSNTAQGNVAAGSNTVSAKTYGFAAGADYRISPSTVVGFALAGSGTGWGLANALGNGTSQAMQVGGYGISRFGSSYVSAALAFTNNWFTLNRSALGDQLTADFSGQSYGARLEGGYRFTLPLPSLAGATAPGSRLGVTPYVALQAQDFSTPNYSETDKTGGGFGLSYAAMNATDVRTELGARFDDPTLLAGKPLILSGRIAWAHDFVGNPALSASFEGLPGASFTVFGAPIPHDLAIASAGAQYFLSPNWSVTAKFYGSFGAGYQTYAGNAMLRYVW